MTIQADIYGLISGNLVARFNEFIAEQLATGDNDVVVGISSPGGNVFAGLSAYGFLVGCGANVTTHNYGHVHSIAGPIFCAGKIRKCSPPARFLVHDVSWGFNGSQSEVQIREALEGLRGDRHSIARILAEAMNLEVDEVEETMIRSETFHAQDAVERGLVHEITPDVFDAGQPIVRFTDWGGG